MVKFSKQLELQLVPEWRSAFCNYWTLKKDLKLVRAAAGEDGEGEGEGDGQQGEAVARGGGGGGNMPTLTRRIRAPPSNWRQNVIKVHHHKFSSNGHLEVYETEVLEPLCGNEREVAFFRKVDDELNKVNRFYASKEDECTQRMESLKCQLANLVDLQKAFEDQQALSSSASLVSSSMGLYLIPQASSNVTHKKSLLRNESQGDLEKNYFSQTFSKHTKKRSDDECKNFFDEEKELGRKEQYTKSHLGNVSNHQVHANESKNDHPSMKLQVSPYKKPPILTMTQLLWGSSVVKRKSFNNTSYNNNSHVDVTITKKKLHYAKKMLRAAFVEYYRGLGLLKTFSSLNMLAFGKILKKHDKVTRRNASMPYLKALERSRLNSSNKVDHLMDEVEKLFSQYFAKDDKKKAMMLLKPAQQKVFHTTTYFIGLFSGWCISFLVLFILLLYFNNERFNNSKISTYVQKTYPIYSMLLWILLHMFMYGWNVYSWREVRINYPFIFEFAPKTELRTREILLVCTSLTTLVAASMVYQLIFYFHGATLPYATSIPFAVTLVFLTLLFCPFNVLHRSSRLFFLKCVKRIILAPFYKVVLADFFLADQLTSQVAAIRQIQYMACYCLGGLSLLQSKNMCEEPKYHSFAYILSFLPYWWRLMQCLRRYRDEGDKLHLSNGGKYLSAMIAAGCRLTFQFYPLTPWLVLFVLSSSLATIYQLYWDFVMDWGLLRPNSKNPWLRDHLILKTKSLYFISMGVNFLLRLCWIQSLTHFHFGNSSDHYLTDFFFASLEIIRRGHWNFYRLENEHLNNVGKFRAVKAVPLPFRDEFVASI